MNKFITVLILVLFGGLLALCAAQQESLSPDLKAVALKDAACTTGASAPQPDAKAVDSQNVEVNSDSTVEALPIRSSGRQVGTIVEV
jgi:uncharacterized protein YcfL